MDLVTFGEAMVRLTPPGSQRIEQARSFDVYVGGSELNVAVAAARLGVKATWLSRLPSNALGRMIASRAREQGVDVSRVAWTEDGEDRAGLYFVELGAAPRPSSVLYDRTGSAMSGVRPGTIDWAAAFHGARWFHTSGITPALSESAAATAGEALVAAKQAGLTVSYDLNYRAKLWSPEKARTVQEPFMRHVDVLIASADTAQHVFGIGEAVRLHERLGIGTIAMTVRECPRVSLNTWSASVFREGVVHRAPTYEVEVVDGIGAGDAFAAGLIAARLRAADWDTAVREATALSALQHTVPGDFSQSTRGEVDQLLGGESLRISR
jgi:2-dehydro-3-deoxygluconokinase